VENDYPNLPIFNWQNKYVFEENGKRDSVYALQSEISLGVATLLINVYAIEGVHEIVSESAPPGRPLFERVALNMHYKGANGKIAYSRGDFVPREEEPFRAEVLYKQWIPGRGVSIIVKLTGTLYCMDETPVSIDAIYAARAFHLDY
jgi:hypothetical protein